jgi:hypothetical protein
MSEKPVEQKPVMWRHIGSGEVCSGGFLRKEQAQWTPLYAAPVPAIDVDEVMRQYDEGISQAHQTAEAEPGSRYYDLIGPENERKLRAALLDYLKGQR